MIMTTFEIIVIIIAVFGVLLIGWLVKVGKDVFEALQVANIQIRDIKSHTNYLINLGYHLPKLVGIVDKMHHNLCVEIADKMVDRVYPPTYVTPCYAPDGICTNPQMDCVGCPKHRSSGGSWSTNANLTKEQGNLD